VEEYAHKLKRPVGTRGYGNGVTLKEPNPVATEKKQ
jgi:hypothetical protein